MNRASRLMGALLGAAPRTLNWNEPGEEPAVPNLVTPQPAAAKFRPPPAGSNSNTRKGEPPRSATVAGPAKVAEYAHLIDTADATQPGTFHRPAPPSKATKCRRSKAAAPSIGGHSRASE